MITKIIIKRTFVSGKEKQIISLLNEIRSKAMNQPGYISGETLHKVNAPNEMTVIATWQSQENWDAWKNSEERKSYEAMLEIYQEGPTEYDEYLLGTTFHS
jgi:heme-degrading monooxygenase HmoA